MNTPQPTPDLESLHKAVQEFQPVSSRIAFHELKQYHEFIVMLRAKRASYRAVAELLENMVCIPVGRGWLNTVASSWMAAKSANGGNGRKPRDP